MSFTPDITQGFYDKFLEEPAPAPAPAPERKAIPAGASDMDLQQYLDAIDPSVLDYDGWLRVGMALHTEGASMELWDAWSQRDPARYRHQEIPAKWRSFNGSGVTAGTLVKLAKDHGWTRPKQDRPFIRAASTAPGGKTGREAPALLCNHDMIEDPSGKQVRLARAISDVSQDLWEITDGWPRRVGNLLFSDTGGIRWLESTDAVFGWAQEQTPLRWAGGSGAGGLTLATKGEFVAHLQAVAQDYDGIATLPYHPALPRHYCAWQAPDTPADGGHLERLLRFFDNADTPYDTALIRAAFLTPAWGGLPGARPAFIVTAPDRGYGKSELTAAIGALYGGVLEGDLTRKGEGELVTRLLSPDALSKRVVRLDNLKVSVGSATLEALITAASVSGRRLYSGEGSRPNYLTWLLTANTPQLSRDIADRAFIIRLRKPRFRPGWKEEVFSFIEHNRDAILADVLAALQGPEMSGPASDRWQSWLDNVLRRCTQDAPAIVALNQERRDEHDEDLDEALAIREALHNLADTTHAWDLQGVAFLPASEVTETINRHLHVNWKAKRVSSVITGHIESGRLESVKKDRNRARRGYEVQKT